MPKRKNFNRRALSCISTRTHLEGRRSVEVMNLFFKPVRASRAQGFQGPYGGSQLALTLYRIYIFCFQMMCNRLPEMIKNGDARIFPVYYSRLKTPYKTHVCTTNDTLPISCSCCRKCKIKCELQTPQALLVSMYRIVIL